MHSALMKTKVPKDAVQFIDSTDREATQLLFTMRKHIDVLIPRGGGSLINEVVTKATVPVLETRVAIAICISILMQISVKAISILVNAKTVSCRCL